MKHYNVVAAVVCQHNRFLCMQKGQTKFTYTSFKFEFPGGKIESGESPQEALKRELQEEMEYEVEVREKIIMINHQYPDFSITLTAFKCLPLSPTFKMNEHIAYEWCMADNLEELDWAAADIGIVKAILNKQ